jgi:hypothetical protein
MKKVPMESQTILRVERTYGCSIGWAIFWLCFVLGVFALAVFATVSS